MRIAITLLLAASAAQAAITGTIVNEEGKPIAGATVQSFASEDSRALRARLLSKSPDRPPSATVQSAENGSFSVTPKTALTDIAIAVGGRQVIGLQLPDGEDAGTIVVPSHASRRIRVLGDGKALPNVLVAAGPFTTRTDAAGMADLIETSIGVTRTAVIHPGYVIQEESIAESQTPTEIKLVKGMSVRGKVAGADGAPVEHAIVSIDGWPLAETDASGDFTLAHAPSQWRSVMAIAGNRAGLAMNKPGQPVEIRLAPAATISGVIRDTSNGRGVAAALVNIHSDRTIESVISDEKGAFSLTAALAGRYTVSGSHPAFQIPPTDIATQSKSIEARPLTRIRGRVIDEKRDPVGGAFLWYGIRGTPPAGYTVISAPDGTFTLRAFVQQFPQPVMAYKAGYAAGTSGPVSTDSAKSALNITLPRGFPLVVKIVDKQRQPIAGANVFVMAGNPTDAVTRYPALCERVSADCHFTDTSGSVTYRIVEGKYQLMIRGDAVANKMVPTDNLTARSSPLTIEVDHGVEVSGRVTYHDGTPVTEAMMVMPRNTFSTSAHTNPDGTFTLRGLPAGPITLITRSPDNPMAQAGSADVTAPAQNVIITIPTPSRIEGRVTDKVTRQPITDFSAAVASQITRFGGAVTTPQFHSEDGTFVLDRVPAGPINLLVSAPGYAAANLGDLTAEEGKPITGVEVQLDRGGKITGRVTAKDQPVAGAMVRYGGRPGYGYGFDPNSTTTDADGQYVIDSIGAGERTIEFFKQGYLVRRKSVEVATGKESRVDMELERGKDLTGRVVDSAGHPLAGVRLYTPMTAGPTPNIFSDAEGNFHFEGLAEGHYTISAMKQGYVNGSASVQVPPAEPITITMNSGGTLTGRVTGLPDSDLSSTTVFASGNNSSAFAQLEPGGTFTLHGVPDGRVAVSAQVNGPHPRQSASKFVEMNNGTAAPVEIDFAQGATVSGHVTESGNMVGGGSVNFSPKRGGETGGRSNIGTDGSYEVSGLSAGDYVVRVFTMRGTQYQTDFTAGGSATFDIDIRGANVHGRVVDASTGAPVSDATVFVEPSKDFPMSRNATSDSEGKFVLTALPDASFSIRANHEGYMSAAQTVVVASAAAPDVEIRLSRGHEAVVRIVDAQSGSPINGYVSVADGKKQVGYGTPGDEGTMHVWLAPGTYKAHVTARTYMPQTVDLVVPGPETRVALTQGGSLMMTSRGGGDARIMLVGMLKPTRTLRLAAGGMSNIDALPPGRYTIELLGKDGVTVKQSYPVDIVAGETARVNMD